MKMKRIMGLFLALAVFTGCLSLNPIASYANDTDPNTFNINNGNVNITKSGNYTIYGTGQPTSNKISVTGSNITATITLKNVNIDAHREAWGTAFCAKGYGQSNVHLTIILEGTNSLTSGMETAGLTWSNSDNNSMLEIQGDGSLTATGGTLAAGIGGYKQGSVENITITGGTVTARGVGWNSGAGIGGGFQGSGKNIKITGGTVTATSEDGAGIGGGTLGSGENITITGGTVKASSISTTPTDGSGNSVYLVKLENQDGVNEVTVDSGTANKKTFTRAGNHPGSDTAFYLYLTGKDHDLVTSKGKYKAEWNNTTNAFTIIEFGPEHGDVHIDADNFPNEHFRSYVKQFDGDNDGWLSKDELEKVEKISIENDQLVSDLKGIEWFKNLKELRCTNNKLTSLDVSKNTKLEQLWCAGNELTSLNVSKNTMLTELHCDRNKLKELDVRENKKLNGLDCSGNELTSLDVSKNKNLTGLWCSGNKLTILDLSENTELDQLSCIDNNLTSLDLSRNKKLNQVYCHGQQYDITVIKGERKFRYSDFPGQFKRKKVDPYYWGAFFSGDALIVNSDNTSEVGYKYVARDDKDKYIDMYVKLNVTYAVVKIDDKHFPDENFRKFVKDNFDKNNNGYLSDDELDGVEELVLYWKQLSSLQGIEYFKNLKRLLCFDSHITSLDVSRNPNLTKLICYDNDLKSLDVSHNPNLTELDCHNTQLKSLDVSHNPNLTNLVCNGNGLTSLDLSNNPSLTHLECTFSQLTSLDVSHNPKLTELQCNNNNLTSLNLNKNTKLTQLDCSNQRYDITVIKGIRKFEYSKFPRGFDKDKVDPDSLVGATLGDDALTVNDDNTREVTYKYKVGDTREMEVKLNVNFIEFNPDHVKSMSVTHQPSKLSYTEDDKLNLDGLVVTLKDDHNLTKDVTPEEFGTYGINADPANQTPLTVADHDKKPVKLTKDGVQAVDTDKLTVKVRVFDSTHVKSMSVTHQPSKLSYTEDDKLNLDGLVVTLKDDHNLTKDVTPAEFGTYGITATPENGTLLTVKDHNDKAVTLTKDGVPAVETDKLKVKQRVFDSTNVKSMSVTAQPSKLSYTDGDKLNLDGLVVTLKDDHNLTKDVTPAEFEANGIKANPENGTELTVADHNGKPVKLSKGNVSAKTDALTVNAISASADAEDLAAAEAARATVSMYRLYNPYTHEHLFTTDKAEYDSLVSAGWTGEGEIDSVAVKQGKGVYRLYNPYTHEHHYTANEDEVADCVNAGWKNEGIKFHSVQNGTVPVYSMYNPYEKKFYHHYTSDPHEIVKMVKAGWVKEDIKWYAVPNE